MANLTYRQAIQQAPAGTTTKNASLTSQEIDGNFKSLNDELITKAPLVSPGFSGVPTAPTATAGTNTTQLATTAFVQTGLSDRQPLDAELTAISGLSANGLITRTGASTAESRSIAVSGTGLSVTNADGVAGNPTVTSNATAANTVSTIVARDASGNFSAGTITAALAGNAATATKLVTARTISLTGDVTGSVSFDGSANASITATVVDDSHNHIIANVDGLQTALDGKVAKDSNTGSAALPAGTTAQRSAVPVAGALRFNSTLTQFEGYDGTAWDAISKPDASLVGFQQAGTGAIVRTAQDKMRERVSVKDFGAAGDGVTDDTAAIQAAIDAAAARSACVIFPAGEYIFTEVVVTNLQNVSMSGEGSGSVLRGTVSLVGIGSTIPGSVYRIDITRVCFHGIDKDTSVGIKCEYTWQCRISNCTFKNLLKGVSIVAHSIRDYIEDNFFEEVSFPLYQENSIRSADISFTRNQITPNAIRSIVFQSMDGFSICENTFFASPVAGVTRNHVYVANLTDETLSHNNWVRIQNNTFFECGNPSVVNLPSDGAVVFDGDNVYESQVIITGNLFGWCFQPIRIAGMAVRPSSPNGGVIIADNYIEQQFDKRGECHPIYVANVNKTLDVRGNSIYKTGGNAANTYDAIRVENCTHPRVIANFILNEGVTTHRHGVGFQDCSTPMAALNTIFGSGTADVFGGIKQANITSAVTAKMKGVAWASCIFIYSNSTVSYFEGRFNLSIARTSQGLWVVTFDSSAPSNDTPVPFVVANEALCRIVGSPGPGGFSFETINTTGSRIDPAGAISVAAV